jgi:hypothetical protein
MPVENMQLPKEFACKLHGRLSYWEVRTDRNLDWCTAVPHSGTQLISTDNLVAWLRL